MSTRFLSEHISGIKIIKAFNIERMKVEQNHEVNEELRKSNSKIIYLFGIFRPLMEFAGNLALAILLYFGTKQFLSGTITIGLIFIFVKYMKMFFNPLIELAEQFNIFQSSMAAAEKIFAILEDEPEPEPDDGLELKQPVLGRIEFKKRMVCVCGRKLGIERCIICDRTGAGCCHCRGYRRG